MAAAGNGRVLGGVEAEGVGVIQNLSRFSSCKMDCCRLNGTNQQTTLTMMMMDN